MRDGYERKMSDTVELNLESWRQARMIAFVNAKPNLKNQNLSIWEFMPLPGDPTERDLEAMKQKQIEESQIQLNEAIKFYRQNGVDVNDIKFLA